MELVILCGGKGTRLSEETVTKPKPLVEIDGSEVPIMDGSSTAFVQAFEEVGMQQQTAPRRVIRILEEKGQLSHTQLGRQYVYQAVEAKDEVKQHSLKHLLKTFFGGSITEAVATFLDNPDTDLSAEELEELEKIVQAAKKR